MEEEHANTLALKNNLEQKKVEANHLKQEHEQMQSSLMRMKQEVTHTETIFKEEKETHQRITTEVKIFFLFFSYILLYFTIIYLLVNIILYMLTFIEKLI